MSDEILINVTLRETRVAFVENGVLQEVMIERTRNRGLVGNIYKGKICRVLPGMQAVFVDIGLERAAFLHISDLGAVDREKAPTDQIELIFHDGQELVVQVVKDPIGAKGHGSPPKSRFRRCTRSTCPIAVPAAYRSASSVKRRGCGCAT